MSVPPASFRLVKQLGYLSPVAFGLVADLIQRLSDGVVHDVDGHEVLAALTDRTSAVGISSNGLIVAVNAYFANLLGYPREELSGRPMTEIIAGVWHRDDPHRPVRRVVPHRHREGHIIPLLTTSIPLHLPPHRIYWLTKFERV